MSDDPLKANGGGTPPAEAASSKPLPELPPPPVPPKPKPVAAKPLPPLPSTNIEYSDDDDNEDDAPLLPGQQTPRIPALIVTAPSPPVATYVYILHSFILICSFPALALLLWSYSASKRASFNEHWHEHQLDSYSELGLPQVIMLSGIDIFWSSIVLVAAKKGVYDRLLMLNVIADFSEWALLTAFGVMGIISRLWDRRLCDGEGYRKGEEKHEQCAAASAILLKTELIALGLALMCAVLHFTLLIARCCLDVSPAWRRIEQLRQERWELVERSSEDDGPGMLLPSGDVVDRDRLAPPDIRYGAKHLTSKLSVPFVSSSREGAIRL